MRYLRVKNLHCISDTGDIPLKGINLFLGANSSGKSSVLRVLPLLRQSLDYNKKGPFLWFGDKVDFGSYADAHKRGSDEMSISFGLDLELYGNGFGGKVSSSIVPCDFSFDVNSKANNDFLNNFSITSPGIRIEMSFTSGNRLKGLKINGKDYSFLSNKLLVAPYYYIIPQIRFVNSVRKRTTPRYMIKESDLLDMALSESSLNGQFNLQTLIKVFDSVPFDKKDIVLEKAKETLAKKHPFVLSWETNDDGFEEFYRLLLVGNLDTLLMRLDHSVTESLNRIYYLGPYRSAVERFYRIQNVSVREIDPHGDNMSMYIGNMDSTELESLKDWMESNFGFYLVPEFSKGHLSLLLSDSSDNEKYNLIDKGFGFSQVLPIIISLWHILKNREFSFTPRSVVFAIEQPELHLHPKLQRKLVDIFVKSLKLMRESGFVFNLILETHSPTIINSFGDFIFSKDISKEDVSLVLFNDVTFAKECHQIETVNYNDSGVLENWPLGFLES